MLGDGSSLVQQHPMTLVLCLLLVVMYMFNFALGGDAINKLGLVTSNTLIANKYIWNLVTCCFYETHLSKVVLDVVLLLSVAKGLTIDCLDQFGLYLIFSILASTIGTSTYCFLRFFATGLEEMLMEPIYGFSGVVITLLMYCRRHQKNAPIHFAVPQITYQNLPILIILTQTLLRVFGLTVLAVDIPFSIISLLFSWSWLRFFYRYDDDNGPVGDKSEEFAFIAMFPEALHVVVVPLSTAFYNLVAMFGVFPELEVVVEKKPQHHLYQAKLPESPLIAPMRQDVVMERRRAKALKLLEQAEQSTGSGQPSNWDVEDEESLPTSRSAEFSDLKV